MIKSPVRSTKAPVLGAKVGVNVNRGAKHILVFAMDAKDFMSSFMISAFGIKKPRASKPRAAKRSTKRNAKK